MGRESTHAPTQMLGKQFYEACHRAGLRGVQEHYLVGTNWYDMSAEQKYMLKGRSGELMHTGNNRERFIAEAVAIVILRGGNNG